MKPIFNRCTTWPIALLLVLVSACHAQGSGFSTGATRVTFQARAESADKLLAKLSTQVGLRLECAPSLASTVFVLKVQNRPLSEVMEKLAQVGHAEWVSTLNGYRFTRSAALEAKLRGQERTRTEEGLKKRLYPILDSLSVPLTLEKATAAIRERKVLGITSPDNNPLGFEARWEAHELKLRRLDALQPIYRLIGRCLQDITLSHLAALQPGERAVFSTRPTAAQKPLGDTSLEAIALFVKEETLWREAKQRASAEDKSKQDGFAQSESEEWSPPYGSNTLLWRRSSIFSEKLPTGVNDRIVLSVRRASEDVYNVTLLIVDGRNRRVLDVQGDDFLLSRERPPRSASGWQASDIIANKLPLVALSPMTEVILHVYDATSPHYLNPIQPAPHKEVIEWLIHPAENEPLSLLPTDGFLSAAENKQVNLAACLSDRLMQHQLWPTKGRPLPIVQFLSEAQSEADMDVSVRDGWMIARPSRPIEDQACRLSRPVLGTFLRDVAREGQIPMESYATFVAQQPESAEDSLASIANWILTRGKNGSEGNPLLLQIYGCLTLAQRTCLLQGGQVNYGELNANQRGVVLHALSNAPYYNLRLRSKEGGSEGYGDLSYEPTEIAPKGLDPQSGIRARRLQERYITLMYPDNSGYERIYWKINADQPPPVTHIGPPPVIPARGFASLWWEVHPVTGLHIEADVSPWLWVQGDYREEPGPALGPPKSLADITPELKVRVVEELQFLQRIAIPR